MICALVRHPEVGLILFDIRSCETLESKWHLQLANLLPRNWEQGVWGFHQAIKATGAGEIGDVKAVVLSHLHMVHAGGLENFLTRESKPRALLPCYGAFPEKRAPEQRCRGLVP